MTNSSGRKLSTRLLRKGALIQETYTIFQQWDLSLSLQKNLEIAREQNAIGATSYDWLREVTSTLSSRFSDHTFAPLVVLAQHHVPLDTWKACLLWHIGATDELYYRFAVDWLYKEYQEGAFRIRTENVIPFVRELTDGRIASGGSLSEYGVTRAARDLLLMATGFDLMKGSVVREFVSYHLPEEGFLYVLYALRERESNARRIVEAPEWRLYLMSAEDVEHELLRLHQFRKLDYQVAGSLAQLSLPCDSLMEYASSLTP